MRRYAGWQQHIGRRYTPTDKVFVTDISRSQEVSIKMKTALTTKELGPRFTIAPIDVTAPVTPLAGLSGVYHRNLASNSFSFVLQESPELPEAPRVQPAASFSMIDPNSISDVREVFNHNSSSWFNTPDNRTRDDVVAIPSESLLTTSKVSKMSLGALRTIGLQVTSEAKYSFENFLHVFVAMKTVIGANGRSGHSQIHADSFTIGNKLNIWQANNDMKIEPSFAVNEVCRSRGTICHILSIFRKAKKYLNSALSGGKVHYTLLPIQLEGMQIITRWAKHRLGASCSQPLLLSGNSGFHRFGSFLPGLDVKVRDEIRQRFFTVTVCQMVKGICVTIVLFPSHIADSVKRLSKLIHGFLQSVSLFLCRLKQYTNRSIHNTIIPYNLGILQRKEVEQFLCQLKQAIPLS